MFGDDLITLAMAVAVVVLIAYYGFQFIMPMLDRAESKARVQTFVKAGSDTRMALELQALEAKENRRKQVQDSLGVIGQKEKEKQKRRMSLRNKLDQAGVNLSPRMFYLASAGLGVFASVLVMGFGAPLFVALLAGFAAGFGLPRWILNFFVRRRQNKFLNDFADAIDVLVRGLKSGLPVTEAIKIISTEQGPPVGPEFMSVVEGQKVGIPIDQGVERMVERVPLPEVNFLSIVMTIQSKTGGNLSEALANLSRVLRDRKKMKQKIQAVSQEAKSSAAIIGSLPFFIMFIVNFLNPTYLTPLFSTQMGHVLLGASAVWMGIGILVMRRMINFRI